MDKPPEFLQAKYNDVQYLDSGGYGRVYKCTREGKTTAVKILDDLNPEAQRRFKSEIEILRCVNHENIVIVLAAGETDGYYWYESEYATLGHYGTWYSYAYSDLERVNYFRQICFGVQRLHELTRPIIHRDLKPRNILVFEDSERKAVLKIADFGLAAIANDSSNLTKTGGALGTAYYIAPERIRSPHIKTPESDIYSLGITFLEAFTGRPRLSQENLNLVPEIIRPIIEKMTRENPRERHQSVAEILDEFNKLSYWRLFAGREPRENEGISHIYQVNINRHLENALEFLNASNLDNVLERLAALERTLDRLGDAHDHEALTLATISRNTLALIEAANREALGQLIQRFDNAAENTTEQDFFYPGPNTWPRFLADTFVVASYFSTKRLCLEGLVKFLDRFGNVETKHHLYQTIIKIDDPNDMKELAEILRERGYEDVAVVLDGVPDQRDLDSELLESALRGAN